MHRGSSYDADDPMPMVIIDERDVQREEAPPHGKIGMSTAYRMSELAPRREMEFTKRTLHVGAAVGQHVLDHDEVYYVLSGTGRVFSDGENAILRPGMAAYLYEGADVGIEQTGSEPLTIIISYPLDHRR
ncbi:cupin domain-containing protein [Parvularcula sp. LCG005]|uniref:cupin domain-containing protein n=1 Tax=Parvularcula sp. LCG005 TaxID=3078805 RepID=UPI00397D7F99